MLCTHWQSTLTHQNALKVVAELKSGEKMAPSESRLPTASELEELSTSLSNSHHYWDEHSCQRFQLTTCVPSQTDECGINYEHEHGMAALLTPLILSVTKRSM